MPTSSPTSKCVSNAYEKSLSDKITTAVSQRAKFDPADIEEFESMKTAIIEDPLLTRYNHRQCFYLCTDFSQLGFAAVGCQPADDAASLDAMTREMSGGTCEFFTSKQGPQLRPIAFKSRKCRGFETRLHSYLGEGFAGDFGIHSFRHYTSSQRFTWITDCYAIKFILTYAGTNPVVLRLQMRLMMWAVDIVHRTGNWLVWPDYFSRLGVDTTFDPLLAENAALSASMLKRYPPPTGPMEPHMWPGYRQKRKSPSSSRPTLIATPDHLSSFMALPSFVTPDTADSAGIQSLLSSVQSSSSGLTHLAIHPIQFHSTTSIGVSNLLNNDLSSA